MLIVSCHGSYILVLRSKTCNYFGVTDVGSLDKRSRYSNSMFYLLQKYTQKISRHFNVTYTWCEHEPASLFENYNQLNVNVIQFVLCYKLDVINNHDIVFRLSEGVQSFVRKVLYFTYLINAGKKDSITEPCTIIGSIC